MTCTKGIQKVHRLTQLAARYAHHILSERWRNAGPSAFQLQVSMLKSDKI